MQIDRHIAVLEEFEQKYGEYLVARHNRGVEGSEWSRREWAERERNLRRLAPRADAAMAASGLDTWVDLPGVILDFEGWTGFSSFATEDKLQREILARLPSQIEGLKMRREEAEEASRKKGRRLRETFAWPRSRWGWLHDPNPWVLTIIGAVIAGLVVLALWAAITA